MEPTETTGLKRRILDTARTVLMSEGYSSLSMRRIAHRIGYSATSIYLYFKNKDQLVHALIDEGVEMLYDRLSVSVEGVRDPTERLVALCTAYLSFGLANPEYYEIMYILHPEYMERYPADKYRKWRRNLELMAESVQEGTSSGLFGEINPMLAANTIWAQLHGVVTLLNSERIDRRISPDELMEQACRGAIRSLSTRTEGVDAE